MIKLKSLLVEDFHVNQSKAAEFKRDILRFMLESIRKGYIDSVHKNLTTTDYKLEDWAEGFAGKFINEFECYLSTMNKQGDRNL